MNWIKSRWDQFALLVCALLLLLFSLWLITKALGFGERFVSLKREVVKSTEVEPVDTSALEAAEKRIAAAPAWDVADTRGSLFVARKYIIRDKALLDITAEGSPPLYPPVPNDWFRKYDLPILETNVLEQDADGDKFSNREEFDGQTDPTNPESHPPFWRKLRLKEFVQTKFRVLLSAYTGDPLDPSSLTFQINTLDVKQPTQFLKLEDKIEGTKFVIKKFDYKSYMSENGVKTDISELTVENTESADTVILINEKIANSPDSFAVFSYLTNGSEFKVKLGKTFQLPPLNTEYNVVDISSAQAVIQDTQTGEKHTIPKLGAPLVAPPVNGPPVP